MTRKPFMTLCCNIITWNDIRASVFLTDESVKNKWYFDHICFFYDKHGFQVLFSPCLQKNGNLITSHLELNIVWFIKCALNPIFFHQHYPARPFVFFWMLLILHFPFFCLFLHTRSLTSFPDRVKVSDLSDSIFSFQKFKDKLWLCVTLFKKRDGSCACWPSQRWVRWWQRGA